MIRLEFTDEEKAALDYERYHHSHSRVRQKMEVLWLKSQGLPHDEICRLASVNGNTLASYLRQYAEGGIAGLKADHFHRPQSDLNVHEAILKPYFDAHPPATIKEAVARIFELTGIKRSLTQVRKFLKKIGMKRRVCGVLPAKADPEKQEEFKNAELQPRLDEAKDGKRSVFFVDAAHFVFGAFVCALWCFARTWIKTGSGRQRFNVLGAVNAITKEVVTVTNNVYINSGSVCELLRKIKALELPTPITLVLDNAKYQKCALVKDLASALDIELLFLPTYSPNLNLIERLWKFVKKQCLYAKYYENFDAFTKAIEECLEQTRTTYYGELKSLLTLKFQTFKKS
jgi:transposase